MGFLVHGEFANAADHSPVQLVDHGTATLGGMTRCEVLYRGLASAPMGSQGRPLAVVMVFSALACGKPAPDKVCSHEAQLSPLVAQGQCTDELAQLQRADAAKYEAFAACALAALNVATLRECDAQFHPRAVAEANKPASVDEARDVIREIVGRLRSAYKRAKTLCPSARAVPGTPGDTVSWSDLTGDPGWGCVLGCDTGPCIPPKLGSSWMTRPTRWQYAVHTDKASVTVTAVGPAGGGKSMQVSKTVTVDGDTLADGATDWSEQTLP